MKCEICEHIEYIDTDGFCMANGCPVLVIYNHKPTKNYADCQKVKEEMNIKCGTMAYQKEVNNEKQS